MILRAQTWQISGGSWLDCGTLDFVGVDELQEGLKLDEESARELGEYGEVYVSGGDSELCIEIEEVE